MRRPNIPTALTFAAMMAAPAFAGDTPSPVPVTRPEIKRVLEGSKHSRPRLPLPPLTEAEKARLERAQSGVERGVFAGIVNNARMRNYYLAPELRNEFTVRPSDLASRDPKAAVRAGASDPSMPLDPTFRVMFFWLVARMNNCYYCLGHQEVKLKAAGVGDDRLAALDTDWSAFNPAERAAFTFVVKLGRRPDEIVAADLDALRKHFNDREILDILVSTGGFAAMTRWTGGLMIPQEDHRVYLTPTSEPFVDRPSLVAPLDPSRPGASLTCAPATTHRPALESRKEVEARLAACRSREPRLPLVDEDRARAVVPAAFSSGPLPQWIRLLAQFPEAGKARILSLLAAQDKGALDRTLRAQIAWAAAREDRAWYAIGHARRRLRELGQSDDAIFALDDPKDPSATPARTAVLSLARKLTVNPALVTDADVQAVRDHFSDRETAEVVYFITTAAFFDRVTEAAGLRLEF